MSIIGNNLTIVNQILPHKNKWAWDLYLKGCSNNWMPTEISMQKDIEQWKSNLLTDDERLLIKRCLGFFACSESLVSNNLLLTVFRYIQDGECRQYIMRQMNEEALHNLTVVYCCDSLNLDIKEIYEAYITIPSVTAKDSFLMEETKRIYDKDFNIDNFNDKLILVKNLFIYYILCEGLMFYSGFAALLSLKRRNLMPGLGQQIEYTLRDEALHVQFGTKLLNIINDEYDIFNINDAKPLIHKTIELELNFAKDMLPNGLIGLNINHVEQYLHFLANKRCSDLYFSQPFNTVTNPFNWLSETLDLSKMKNFFESRVIDYKIAAMIDDF